jgi:HEAT repeat protein
MQFDSRAGTCGDGADVIGYGRVLFARNFMSIGGHWNGTRCVPGPLRVTLTVERGEVTREQTQVGGEWPSTASRVTDLGVVPSRDASAYFFALVPRLETRQGKDRLLLPAVLAADADAIPPLLALARDESRAEHTRQQAVQWVGLLGDASVIPALVQFARADVDEDGDDRRGKHGGLGGSAMAALASLEGNVGVPALIDLAHGGGVGTRRNAVFWLGQNGDPRALRALHEVIENGREDDRVRAHAIFSLSQSSDAPVSEYAYLRGLFPRLGEDDLQEAVLQGQMQDESDVAGRWLLDRVRDTKERTNIRRTALFWAGQRGATPTAELVKVYRDISDTELREHAIFVLSQRQDDEATDALMRIAREDKDTEMRGKALFWLAQKHDPRVTKLISDLLLK